MSVTDTDRRFDIAIVGTGFASSFFLHRLLKNTDSNARIVVIERGKKRDIQWQRDNYRQLHIEGSETFTTGFAAKEWLYTPSFGGGSNCWWACTPRFLPEDFEMKHRFGFDRDWPFSYEQLEPFYCEAEDLMSIAGDSRSPLHPRSRDFPFPPHIMTEPDRVLANAHPGLFTALPSARARKSTSRRPACCASGVCNLCPIDAKFTILNEFSEVYADPRVTLLLNTEARYLETEAGKPSSLVCSNAISIKADQFVLGANAIFNPAILLRSGLEHPLLGHRLNEQIGVEYEFDLNGMDNYQGSTSLTGHGYMEYAHAERRSRSAALIETSNIPRLRLEKGKWRQRLTIKCIFEDKPSQSNYLRCSQDDKPELHFSGYSGYALDAIERMDTRLSSLLSALPIEKLNRREIKDTEGHILGTTCMGKSVDDSVVDGYGRVHGWPNVVVLGGSNFPTSSPSNPTLTICAMSLRSAQHLFPARTS